MRLGLDYLLAFSLISGSAFAQQLSLDKPTAAVETNSLLFQSQAPLSHKFPDVLSTPSSEEAIRTKKLQISGPLVSPFKAHRVLEVPRRLLHLINPFARRASESRLERAETVEARAWTTMVGWRPGQSAFADDRHHEAKLRLVTITPGE